MIQAGGIKSAHDCSEGGLAVALAECCVSQLIARNTPRLIGAKLDLSSAAQTSGRCGADEHKPAACATIRLDALLFGETQHRVVVTCKELDATKIVERAKLMGVPAQRIGTVGGDTLTLQNVAGEFSAPLTELHDGWWNSIARAME